MHTQINKIDTTKLTCCVFVPWDAKCTEGLFLQLMAFQGQNLTNSTEAHAAIEALEILRVKLSVWMIEYGSFAEDETDRIMLLFLHYLGMIKANEGVDFNLTLRFVKKCTRLIKFVLGVISDDWDFNIPAVIHDLERSLRCA